MPGVVLRSVEGVGRRAQSRWWCGRGSVECCWGRSGAVGGRPVECCWGRSGAVGGWPVECCCGSVGCCCGSAGRVLSGFRRVCVVEGPRVLESVEVGTSPPSSPVTDLPTPPTPSFRVERRRGWGWWSATRPLSDFIPLPHNHSQTATAVLRTVFNWTGNKTMPSREPLVTPHPPLVSVPPETKGWGADPRFSLDYDPPGLRY
jgi:hypothetical protein